MNEKPTVEEIIDRLEEVWRNGASCIALIPADARALIDGVREMQEEIKKLRQPSTYCHCGRTMIYYCPWCDANLESKDNGAGGEA